MGLSNREQLKRDVVKELNELKRLGVNVSDGAFEYARTEDLTEYDNLSVSEITDLVRDLGDI